MHKFLSSLSILTFTLIIACRFSYAQSFPTDRGSKIISGGFTYSSAGGDLYKDSDDNRFTLVTFNPSISYFVSPGLAAGGNFTLQRFSQGNGSSMSWGIGPQLLYFIGGNQAEDPVKGTIYPYIGVSFLYTKSTSKVEFFDETQEFTTSSTTISFRGGILRMLSDTVGLFGEATYDIDSLKPEEEDSVSGNKFNILAGFTIFLY